jgi:predicted amidohydrolase YtcJ
MRREAIVMTVLGSIGCAGPADVVLTGGHVWTGAGTDATAVAVRDGRIIAVGNDAAVERLGGSGTETVALDGRFVVPGFMDNHTHFVEGGFELASVQLRDAATPAEFIRRIAEHARRAPDAWVTGGTWDHELWGGELPRREPFRQLA